MDCKYSIEDTNFKIKIVKIKTKCKYHKKIGAIYLPDAIAPKGMCLELFHTAYSGCLSVLYNGLPVPGRPRKKGIQQLTACCPAPDGIGIQIRAEEILPPPIRIVKDLCAEILKKFHRGYDSPFRRVFIEVTHSSSYCPKNYTVGDRFEFNINKKDELCPAGFSAIYPYFRILKNNKDQGLPDSICVHCPDYVGVIYEITTG